MRRHTVISTNFGNMPLAGYITEIMRVVTNFDGWYALEFAKDFTPYAEELDDAGCGELFIILCSETINDMYGDLEYKFITSECGLNVVIDEMGTELFKPGVCRIFRLFGHDEEFGLEELQILF